jgi:hypothetical protein
MDLQFDATADGRRLSFLSVVYEHRQISLAVQVD